MALARKHQVSLDVTPYYHCVTRCVRRAFLCGEDSATGKSFEHRRGWMEERLLALQSIFAIDIAAYAIMSNHYHVVLHVDRSLAEDWDDFTVVARWHCLFKGTLLTQKFARQEPLGKPELEAVAEKAAEWRQRLMDISWFIRCLNEPIARQANQEDQCAGRFWEGRFKSQALLDEKALMACMAYVDLNPVRAKMAETPEDSDHTSIKRRVETVALKKLDEEPIDNVITSSQTSDLMPFVGCPRAGMPQGLPFRYMDYLQLLDWTGRQIRSDRRGYIDHQFPDILNRLKINPTQWLVMSQHFESRFRGAVGVIDHLKQACRVFGRVRVTNLARCQLLLG